jgi:hypothetical protein
VEFDEDLEDPAGGERGQEVLGEPPTLDRALGVVGRRQPLGALRRVVLCQQRTRLGSRDDTRVPDLSAELGRLHGEDENA